MKGRLDMQGAGCAHMRRSRPGSKLKGKGEGYEEGFTARFREGLRRGGRRRDGDGACGLQLQLELLEQLRFVEELEQLV